MTRRPEKAVWLAHLPKWREGAVGRIAPGTVFLIVCIDHEPGRFVRVEIPTHHARALAADITTAADRDEHTTRHAITGTTTTTGTTGTTGDGGNRPTVDLHGTPEEATRVVLRVVNDQQ